jgi:hypothetical protein
MSERLQPYDMVFGTGGFEAEVFPAIREEAEARGVDVHDRERFIMLVAVGDLMRAMLPDDAGTSATQQFSALVWHAYHCWLARKPVFEIDGIALRKLLSADTVVGSWDMTPPAPAGYVQLARNTVFARIDENAQPEAVDGFFFVMPGVGIVDALLVLGLVPQRGGFSVVEAGTSVTAEAAGHFGDVKARPEGDDFSNLLPGGERLFAITNTLEALKLVSRCFWRLTGHG